MRKILTPEQIQEATQLKEQGKSKRQISYILGIPQTTVWDNIFNTKKRVRTYSVYIRRPVTKQPCSRCEILMTRDIKGNFIPRNYKVGDICIACYLEEKGIDYLDLLNK